MKRFGSNLIAWTMVALTASITYSVANAGPYDFELGGDKNNLRKAYLMCSFKHFQGGDCPDVLEECHKPKNMSFSGKTTCQKAPRFGDKNAEADQALNDGAAATDDAEAPTAVSHTAEQTAAASNLDDMATAENACEIAADAVACNNALAADTAGEAAYDTSSMTLAAGREAALEAGQEPVVASLAGGRYVDSGGEAYAYDPELDGPILDIGAIGCEGGCVLQ
jgi:hypothetical protein